MSQESIQSRAMKTIKFLSMDGIQTANSGHPGLPMGDVGIAYTLWMKAVGKHHAWSPGIWANTRRGSDHRTFGAGIRQRCGYGNR